VAPEHVLEALRLDHPDDQEWNTNFRVAFINAQYTWERQVKVIDPVARVAKDFQKIEIGKIYAYLFSPKDVQIGLMHDTQYSFYTGEPVLEGDLVGGKIVKKVMDSLGVKLVHVS